MYVNAENVTYFDCFGVKHIPKEIRKIIGNKNIITNIYRIQAYDSIMWECFCIGFVNFKLKDKSLLEYTNLFSPNKTMLSYCLKYGKNTESKIPKFVKNKKRKE